MRIITEETISEMKKIISEFEKKKIDKKESPYIEEITVRVKKKYNPNFGDNRECKCGHPYHRHFDSYEQMSTVGCKYCQCFYFKEKKEKKVP
jgi:hypothetical protein